MTTSSSSNPTRGRWWIVVAAVLVQLALGAVYAWSVFNKPLQAEFGWSKTQAVLPFEVAIGTIFIGSLVGGRIQDRYGPRPVAFGGVVLYSAGIMLASLVSSPGQLWLLVLTYGAMGGIGLGAAYITPIAMLAKWFPDRRGLITGIAVAGFGFGAVITAPVAKALLGNTADKTSVFLPLGIAYLVAGLIGATFFRNPPEGYAVPGFVPASTGRAVAGTRVYTLPEALHTRQWYQLTAILALNVTCGIGFISQAADSAEDIAGVAATTAATMVGILGLFNGGGRIFWAWLSDRVGRMQAFLGMLGLQAICFAILPFAAAFALFAILAAFIYLAYGGGFGTMPATSADYFGTPNAGAIYGAMIVAWSIGGVVGPLLTAALYEANNQSYTLPFLVLAGIALVAMALPLITKMPSPAGVAAESAEPAR
ncbi:OFA family MFS transporter [Actinoplanes sp. KI2]|uniref:L-lactate MFS transporter n=1 Tax=Actinoplanes sp. KI2 TaxID=2983315 RepID=UPI0021D5F918|nr:OFA family MFS transporter [Actinoplanes sp. KI2]MCU7727048.1 OFA family MFS transporter [Actinoplanes sp. KI2]